MTFQVGELGELVYFFRKGKNATSRSEPGWYSPAGVLGVEKTGDSRDNQGQGSIVWIAHGTVLYRCAPEQLRHVTQQLADIHVRVSQRTVFDEICKAGAKQNFKNIALEMEDEPEDSELHDEEPNQNDSSTLFQAPRVPLVRAWFKQSDHVNRELAAGTGLAQEDAPPDQGGDGQGPLRRNDGHPQQDESDRAGQAAAASRARPVKRSSRSTRGTPLVELAPSAQRQVLAVKEYGRRSLVKDTVPEMNKVPDIRKCQKGILA